MKNWVIATLGIMLIGFWCNNIGLYASMIEDWRFIRIFGDILPRGFSIGDCFLFIGYNLAVFTLGKWIIDKVISQHSRAKHS